MAGHLSLLKFAFSDKKEENRPFVVLYDWPTNITYSPTPLSNIAYLNSNEVSTSII
jgi:hypothetical protein